MLYDVLHRLASDTGFDPSGQRNALLGLLQVAAQNIYSKLEANRMYREVSLVVPPNAVVALPWYIGPLKGMRVHTPDYPFDLHALAQPRYISNTLGYRYSNWRDMGEFPYDQLPAQGNILTLTVQGTWTTQYSVKVCGQTTTASRVEEIVTLNSQSKNTVNAFTKILKIVSFDDRTQDIVISDVNGNVVATLYTENNQTKYQHVDVSQVFWPLDTADNQAVIDVCYKLPLIKFKNDTDGFPGGDVYDDAWYHQAMHLFFLPQEGKQNESQSHLALCFSSLQSAKDGSENFIVKKIQWGRNPLYHLCRPLYVGRRYWTWSPSQ